MKILPMTIILLLTSCAAPVNESPWIPYEAKLLRWLEGADPTIDFETAISASNYRFIGLYGEGLEVPVVDIRCVDHRKDVNFIEGTSDAIMGEEHYRLIQLAYEYAKKYNAKMLKYLKDHHGFKCKT